jgi:hypothetical protein
LEGRAVQLCRASRQGRSLQRYVEMGEALRWEIALVFFFICFSAVDCSLYSSCDFILLNVLFSHCCCLSHCQVTRHVRLASRARCWTTMRTAWITTIRDRYRVRMVLAACWPPAKHTPLSLRIDASCLCAISSACFVVVV